MEESPAAARMLEEAGCDPLDADNGSYDAIVGGGIGGMEAAHLCTIRGHEVTLYEKNDALGGVFNAVAAPDFKEADKKLINWYIKQINDLNVDIKMNTEVTPELIKKSNPDSVIVATGAKARIFPAPGIENDNVI